MANVLAVFIVLQALGLSRALPVCSDTMCAMYCEFGFESDGNGCPICQCRDPCLNIICAKGKTCFVDLALPRGYECAVAGCSDLACDMVCKFGFEKDEAGCDVCICRKEPCARDEPTDRDEPAPLVVCDPLIDKNCKPDCPQVTCSCSNYKVNSDGCQDCDCPDNSIITTLNPLDCPQVTCSCSNYKVNSDGCQECDCPEVSTSTSPSHASTCPKFQCFLYCEFGFVRDSNGCETCQCRSDPCNENTCPANEVCQADSSVPGYVCIPHSHIWCSEEECDLSCESGFEKGENGCDLCKCKEVICQGQVCPPGWECGKVARGYENEPCDPIIEQMCVKVEHCD